MRLLWAGCLEVPDLVKGERTLLCCVPAFRQNVVRSNQTSRHFPCSLFPVPFALRKEISVPGALLSPAAEFSFYPLRTGWMGRAETWAEEQRLNVASERINHRLWGLLMLFLVKQELQWHAFPDLDIRVAGRKEL